MAKRFALWFGTVYVVVALLEVLYRTPFGGLLHFTPLHNGVHWIVGVVLLAGAAKGEGLSSLLAKVVGVVFTALFIAGVAAPGILSDFLGYPVNWLYNVVHLATGLAGLAVGFAPRKAAPQQP